MQILSPPVFHGYSNKNLHLPKSISDKTVGKEVLVSLQNSFFGGPISFRPTFS